jgi:hypothetical protein
MCSASHFLQKVGFEHTTLKMETGRDQVKNNQQLLYVLTLSNSKKLLLKVRENGIGSECVNTQCPEEGL